MGDFSANFHLPQTGIHTVEGNVAGSRAAALTKKREAQQAEFESRKKQIVNEAERGKKRIENKFEGDSSLSAAEREFKLKTVGLVSAEEFKKASVEAEESRRRVLGLEGDGDDPFATAADGDGGVKKEEEGKKETEEQRLKREKLERKARKKALKKKKKMMSTLSFAGAEDAEGIVDSINHDDDDVPQQQTKGGASVQMTKNPEVDTSFLPDRQREQNAQAERLRLRNEWLQKQNKIKSELLEITYSYWDGSGHRRTVHCRKGDTVAQFLELVRKDLAKEFREMGNVSSDALLYVKEDLIIPQDITFYDLIATKARGKSGPLFNFDVHDDVRVGTIDTRVEKDESHPGKVVERRWYDRNKHIFPASRWEVFDPTKEYGKYTIHGGEVNKKKKK